MIRNQKDIEAVQKELFGGPGQVAMQHLLTGDEFHGKGRLFARMTLKPGARVGEHTHTGDFEVYYCLQGEGTFIDNGKSNPFKPGDVAYTWEGDSHSLINSGSEDLVFMALVLFTNK